MTPHIQLTLCRASVCNKQQNGDVDLFSISLLILPVTLHHLIHTILPIFEAKCKCICIMILWFRHYSSMHSFTGACAYIYIKRIMQQLILYILLCMTCIVMVRSINVEACKKCWVDNVSAFSVFFNLMHKFCNSTIIM